MKELSFEHLKEISNFAKLQGCGSKTEFPTSGHSDLAGLDNLMLLVKYNLRRVKALRQHINHKNLLFFETWDDTVSLTFCVILKEFVRSKI